MIEDIAVFVDKDGKFLGTRAKNILAVVIRLTTEEQLDNLDSEPTCRDFRFNKPLDWTVSTTTKELH